MANPPSEQDIRDYLKGLNRISEAALVSPYTAAAKARGIDNYLRWFKQHEIVVYKDSKGVWKLVQAVKHE